MEGRAVDMDHASYMAMRERLYAELGLDRPMPVQFFIWIGQIFRGEFGYSMTHRVSVMDAIRIPMASTILMNILNLILVFAITIPVGVYAAIKRGKLFDNGALFASLIGFSFPGFLFGILMILIFAVFLNWLPTGGMASPIPIEPWTWEWIADRARYMILPLLTLVLMSTATLMRIVRSSMIDSLTMDFVRTARAKGLAEKVVIFSHAFRNALIPIITVMTGWFIGIFSGTVVIERTFNWNGMGDVMMSALTQSDLAILKAVNLFYALIAFIALLAMDIVYTIVDPRIRFD
jgi:peptide/nickel transport system permease protein